jgi:hypothetical protein
MMTIRRAGSVSCRSDPADDFRGAEASMQADTVSIEDMMNFLVEHRAPNLPAAGLAGVFETLTWCLDVEASEEIHRTRRRWLEQDDRDRVEIALAMRETYPCAYRRELFRYYREWPIGGRP